jgi:hypothetical protein
MNKTWINSDKKDDKIISISEDCIIKANPSSEALFQYKLDIENNKIPKDVFSLSFSMIDSIKLYKGKNYIQVFFGTGSEEYLNIIDEAKRKEIFEYLRNHMPNANYRYEEYTAIKSAKKPMIALATTTLVFIWTLYYAIQIDAGNEYLLKGSGKSIVGIVFILANLGTINVILIFGALLGIGLFSMIRKLKNKPDLNEIFFDK